MSDMPFGASLNTEPPASSRRIKEAVCIDTARVYDSCADKDCLADLRVYFTDCAQNLVDAATSIRCRGCDVLNVFTETERVPFNRGYYSVDLTFFFMVALDVYTAPSVPPQTVYGLSVFSKKAILYGSDGNVKVFSSEYSPEIDCQYPAASTNPRVKVQVAEPLCLDARICRPCDCCNNIPDAENGIPFSIRRAFAGNFIPQSRERAVRVTIGLFSIVQLERDVQMLIPAYDFCMPDKECSCATEDPCDSFRKIRFPVSEFFPPDESELASNNDTDSGFEPSCCCGR